MTKFVSGASSVYTVFLKAPLSCFGKKYFISLLIKWLKPTAYTIKNECTLTVRREKSLPISPYQFDTRTHNGGAGVTGFSCVGHLCAGIGMSQIGFTCPSSVNTMYKAFNEQDKIFTVFAKKENTSFVLFRLNCFHFGNLVVSVHDRLLTRKNRKLTYRKRKFKVSPRGSPVNSLHCTSLLKKTHPHLDVAICVWAGCVGHSSVFPVLT